MLICKLDVDYVIIVPFVIVLFKIYMDVELVLFEIVNCYEGEFVLIPSLSLSVSQ